MIKLGIEMTSLGAMMASLGVGMSDLGVGMSRWQARKTHLDEAMAKAEAQVEAVMDIAGPAEEVTIVSEDPTIDCLRLSMHFFHPIQQCAQQIYYTALPLSPTSSQLRKSYLQSITDDQLSHVTAFSGAPDTWGLLLRTIDIRSGRLTHIATFAQRIIAVCEDIVNIYNAVTFGLQQSLCTPETVTKIQGSPDGSILFFAHSHSVTMWDVQTGGLAHTFTTQSKITDIAVSITGDYIACSSSDGSISFWDVNTKEEGKCFEAGQLVVTIHWLSPLELVVATQRAVFIHSVRIGKTLDTHKPLDTRKPLDTGSFSIPGHVWGMVKRPLGGGVLVGASRSGKGAGQHSCFFEITESEITASKIPPPKIPASEQGHVPKPQEPKSRHPLDGPGGNCRVLRLRER
jgi:hypothetical protein